MTVRLGCAGSRWIAQFLIAQFVIAQLVIAQLVMVVMGVAVVAVSRASADSLFEEVSLVDLSHAYDDATIYWPTEEEGFQLEREAGGITERGYWYAANKFSSAEHGGTHIDAPQHFAEMHWTVDQIPLDHLVGPAIVVDVVAQSSADPDYEVSVADFTAWEGEHGRIEAGTIVLLRTGFGVHWRDRARYLGTSARGPAAVAELHFPGLAPSAAKWLVEERRIHAVGLDTASIDRGQSTLFESHRTLFAANVPAFENLANLARLPARGFDVIALPMKIRGGSGAPLRALALLPK